MSNRIIIAFSLAIIFNLFVVIFFVWLIFAVINRLNKTYADNIKMVLEHLRNHDEVLQKYHNIYARYIQEEIDTKKQIISYLEDALKQIDTLQDQLQELQSWRNSEEIIINKPFDRSVLDDPFWDPSRTMPTITCEEAQDD